MTASRSKTDRNKRLFDAVLDGMGFKEVGEVFGVGQVRARQLFLCEIRNAGSEIWDEGVRSGISGAYATPPLKWIRDNKDRVVAAIESGSEKISSKGLSERRICRNLARLTTSPAIAASAGPEALRDRAEGQSAFDLQAQVEALKPARAADEVGLDVVIRELREEVARLKGGTK